MQQRRHNDKMTWKEAMRYLPHVILILVLWSLAMTKDYSASQTTERMTKEQVEAIAKERTSTLVGCAKGYDIWVGDLLIDCTPLFRFVEMD